MFCNRLVATALGAFAASICALLLITEFGDRIVRLTGAVAGIRSREAAVRDRLVAKQGQLGRPVSFLDIAKGRLDRVRAHLGWAVAALRRRLVAMYKSGSPDLIGVVVGSADIGEISARAEYLDRLQGMDEAIVSRVTEPRDEADRIVARRRAAKNTIESARGAIASEERQLADSRTALKDRQRRLLAARAQRVAALAEIGEREGELDGSVAAIQGKIAAQLASGFAPRRRLRQLHLHRSRRRALHLLRPPELLRGLGPGSRSTRARSSVTPGAPATASDLTFISRFV